MVNRNEAKAVWNDKGCKKGMLAIEKNWADIGNGEPFTMAAIAKIFRTESGEPPDKLDLKEVGEFLAGGAPHTPRCRHQPAVCDARPVVVLPAFPRHALAWLRRRCLKRVGCCAGKPQQGLCRNEFIDTFDFTNNTFVQAMRAFLGCAVASRRPFTTFTLFSRTCTLFCLAGPSVCQENRC